MAKAGRKRMHDYELIAQLLKEEPALEGSPGRLAKRYTERHPRHLPISSDTVRSILGYHAEEMLGRERARHMGAPRRHDYEAIRELIAGDRTLATSPTRLAAAYQEKTGREIHRKYITTMLRRHRRELVPPGGEASDEQADG